MPNLLAIFSSPRGDQSASTVLTHTFIESWKSAHPDGKVAVRDLYKTELPFIDPPWIAAMVSAPETHTPEMARAIEISDKLIAELQEADHLVIGTPMYNFSVPAILKAWIDHIVRVGVTVSPSYEGQLKGKKATVIIASGGVYNPGSHMESYNLESGYVKLILGFVGITDVSIVLAGGSSEVMKGKMSFEELVAKYEPEVKRAAR